MKKSLLFFILLSLTFPLFSINAMTVEQRTDSNGASYEFIQGDPFKTRKYMLDNGLTIYLSRNTQEPRIQSFIVVRAGSADDPLNSTGLAHYFEHMMFKGNSKIASLDWSKEKPLLDELETLFERHRSEKDLKKRAEIYKKIDRISGEAAKYSNDEYWQLCGSMGQTGTNAWTSVDQTVYKADIPNNQLEKFLKLESIRFSDIVLRRFHTELETVYEEYNRGQDKDTRLAWNKMMELMFPQHPYSRAVIGFPEHLKAPSMRDIYRFYRTYYIPSNMAIILSGDLEYDQTFSLVKKYFGGLKNPAKPELKPSRPGWSGTIPQKIRSAEVTGPQAEVYEMGWIFEPVRENELYLSLLEQILCNGKCGLIETDLLLPGKVLSAGQGAIAFRDGFVHIFSGKPKAGQTLEQVRELLLAEIDKVKKGDFPDWLIPAIVNNTRLSLITAAENRSNAAYSYLDPFTRNYPFVNDLNAADDLSKITKKDMMAFVQKHYKNNYAEVFKRSGTPKDRLHVKKPPIHPVPVQTKPSDFAVSFYKMKPGKENEPVFPDFKKILAPEKISDGMNFCYAHNDNNERFSLTLSFPAGTLSDKRLDIACSYFDFLGTDRYTPAQLKQEWYKLASTMSVSSGLTETSISLHGLQRNFDRSLALFNHVLSNVKADGPAWKQLIDRIEKARIDRRKNPGSILGAAHSYALYDGESFNSHIVPVREMRKMKPETAVEVLKSLRQYKHDIVYYGPASRSEIRKKTASITGGAIVQLKNFGKEKSYRIRKPEKNMVYFLNYPGTQVRIFIARPDAVFQVKPYLFEQMYSAYAKTVFFNELRERRSLAYSANGYYTNPGILFDNYSLSAGFIAVQPDKVEDALKSMLGLLDNLPETATIFNAAKEKVAASIRNRRISPEQYYSIMKDMERFHLTRMENEIVYQSLPSFSPADLIRLSKEHISRKKSLIVVMGDEKQISMDMLKKFGELHTLTLNQIFPND